jgi:prolipoprotein diacylglyceryltransferase
VTTGVLQHLPIAAGITNSAGVTEYRFATFFVHFLLMLLFCMLLLKFFMKYRNFPMKAGRREGNTVNMFLLLYAASEMILDSTRYDSSFLPQNGFVSIVQIVAAVCMLLLLIHYSRMSLRANGRRFWHFLLWLLWLAALGGGGYMEYLVQRHGDWYLSCYAAMSFCCLVLAGVVHRLYLTSCGRIQTEEE